MKTSNITEGDLLSCSNLKSYLASLCDSYINSSFIAHIILPLVLILSGDIELNPGPETLLRPNDLKEVRNLVWNAQTKWYDIGVELSLNPHSLRAIRRDYSNNSGDCFNQILQDWLEGCGSEPTWKNLAAALNALPVNFPSIAKSIEEKFITPEESKGREELVTEVHHPKDTLSPAQQLTEGDKDHLKARIRHETNEIKRKFVKVVFQLQKNLEKTSVQVDDVINVIACMDPDFSEVLEKCDSIAKIFRVSNRYWTFFDYILVKILIDNFGTPQDKSNLEEYLVELKHYCRRMLCDCPTDAFGKSSGEDPNNQLIIKIDGELKTMDMRKLEVLRSEFSMHLKIKYMRLLSVDEGCVQLTFLTLPKKKELEIPEEKQEILRNLGVLSIHYGDQEIDLLCSDSTLVEPEEIGDFDRTIQETPSCQKTLLSPYRTMTSSPPHSIARRRSVSLKRQTPVTSDLCYVRDKWRLSDSKNITNLYRGDSFRSDFSDDDYNVAEVDVRHDRLKLPVRAQSLKHRKSQTQTSFLTSSPSGYPDFSGAVLPFSLAQFAAGQLYNERRWSIVSASSGYFTNSPGSLSSHPSDEQIHQLPKMPTMDDSSSLCHWESNSSVNSDTHEEFRILTLARNFRSLQEVAPPDFKSTRAIFEDKISSVQDEMEEKLQEFLIEYPEEILSSVLMASYGKHKILECAYDILDQSQNGSLDTASFVHMSDCLELILIEEKEQTKSKPMQLQQMVRKLLTVVGQTARLFELKDFKPEKLNNSELVSSSLVPYVQSRLGILTTGEENTCDELSGEEMTVDEMKPNLDDFTTVRTVSKGDFSVVHLVRHDQMKKRFALKKISKHWMDMKQIQQDSPKSTLNKNPFLVGLWCTFSTENCLSVVMEYLEGGDLSMLLKNVGCLTLEVARGYFAEMVLALEYIQNLGIIHRHLKPDNILITCEGHIKVTDYGLSKIGLVNYTAHVIEEAKLHDHVYDSKVYKNLDYIAPEVILGQEHGFGVDWWSMGVILHAMLIGTRPFRYKTLQELFDQIINENHTIIWHEEDEEDIIQKEVKQLIQDLLCSDPHYRLGGTFREGIAGVKRQPFFKFSDSDWQNLLQKKVEYMPKYIGKDAMSYHETSPDYHTHSVVSDEEDVEATRSSFRYSYSATIPSQFSTTPSKQSSLDKETQKLKERKDSGISESEEKFNPTAEQSETAENSVTNIDDVSDKETNVPPISRETTPSPSSKSRKVSNLSVILGIPSKPKYLEVPYEPAQPSSRSQDHSSTFHAPSSTIPHMLSPLSSSMTAQQRRVARIEDVTQLMGSHDFSFTVSPSTPDLQDSSTSNATLSMRSPVRNSMTAIPFTVSRSHSGYGLMLKSIRVYIGNTNDYKMHHIIENVDEMGPAWEAGLHPNQLVTHINGEAISGLQHVQVITLTIKRSTINISTIPLDQTTIRKDKQVRDPFWGHRIGKLLRHHSSSSQRVRKKSSINRFRDMERGYPRHSSSNLPSPLVSSPHRSSSFKNRKNGNSISILARNTSPSPSILDAIQNSSGSRLCS